MDFVSKMMDFVSKKAFNVICIKEHKSLFYTFEKNVIYSCTEYEWGKYLVYNNMIISIRKFEDHFMTLREFRNRKIDEILADESCK